MRMAVEMDKTQKSVSSMPNSPTPWYTKICQVCWTHPHPWSLHLCSLSVRRDKNRTELQTQPEGKGTAGDSLIRTEMEGAPGSSQIPTHWARLEPS